MEGTLFLETGADFAFEQVVQEQHHIELFSHHRGSVSSHRVHRLRKEEKLPQTVATMMINRATMKGNHSGCCFRCGT